MEKQYIRLKYVVRRESFEDSLGLLLNSEEMERWKKCENKYIGFCDSCIDYIMDYTYFDEPIEKMQPYYSGFLYTPEEVQKIREFGQYIYDWHCKLHPKAEEYAKKHRNYDYVYLTDERLPEILEKAKELYNYLKANDEKYDYERSLDGHLNDSTWYDDDYESHR